ncbi:hypothetical protein Landi51_12367 [Colletotrichum acutatum]
MGDAEATAARQLLDLGGSNVYRPLLAAGLASCKRPFHLYTQWRNRGLPADQPSEFFGSGIRYSVFEDLHDTGDVNLSIHSRSSQDLRFLAEVRVTDPRHDKIRIQHIQGGELPSSYRGILDPDDIRHCLLPMISYQKSCLLQLLRNSHEYSRAGKMFFQHVNSWDALGRTIVSTRFYSDLTSYTNKTFLWVVSFSSADSISQETQAQSPRAASIHFGFWNMRFLFQIPTEPGLIRCRNKTPTKPNPTDDTSSSSFYFSSSSSPSSHSSSFPSFSSPSFSSPSFSSPSFSSPSFSSPSFSSPLSSSASSPRLLSLRTAAPPRTTPRPRAASGLLIIAQTEFDEGGVITAARGGPGSQSYHRIIQPEREAGPERDAQTLLRSTVELVTVATGVMNINGGAVDFTHQSIGEGLLVRATRQVYAIRDRA